MEGDNMKNRAKPRDKKTKLIYVQTIPEALKNDDFPYIYVTEFKESTVKEFYKEFSKLNCDDEVKVIPIVISSYGGEVYSLLSMLDIMKTANKPVATIAMGKAMSCGAVLLSAGTKGLRFAGEMTDVLIHEVSGFSIGKNLDIQNDAEKTKKLNMLLMRILAENCGIKDKDHFIKLAKSKGNIDLYFTAKESKKLGLIDHISIPELVKV